MALAERFNLLEERVKAILRLKELEQPTPYDDPELDRRTEILEILAEHAFMVTDHEMPAELPNASTMYEIYPQHYAPEDFDPRKEEGWIHPTKKVPFKVPKDEIPVRPLPTDMEFKSERELASIVPPLDDKGYARKQGHLLVLWDESLPNSEMDMLVTKRKYDPPTHADSLTRWRFFNWKYPNAGRRFISGQETSWLPHRRPPKYVRPPRFLTPRPIPHDIGYFLDQIDPVSLREVVHPSFRTRNMHDFQGSANF